MELNQTSICYYAKKLSRISSCTETMDSIVPDTYPDIGRVICAFGTAEVKDQAPQSGRLLISGTVQTCVMYQPETGSGARILRVPISFAHIEECEEIDAESICHVMCSVAAVDATPVNSRKLNLNVQLCFESECFSRTTAEITEEIKMPDLQIRSVSQPISVIEQMGCFPITVLEDVSLADAVDLQLLHTVCTMQVHECRAMNGRAVIKGEAGIQCLALQPDGAVRKLDSSTPFTQILEMPDLTEGDTIASHIAVREMDCKIEPDGLLSYTITADALVTMRKMHTIQMIRDMYLPGREIRLSEEKVPIRSMPQTVPFTAEGEETLQTAQHISHVISANVQCCSAKRSAEEELQLNAAVQVLYLDDEQQLCALQRIIPLNFSVSASGELSQLETSARATSAGDRGLCLAVTVKGRSAVEDRLIFRKVTSFETKDAHKRKDNATLILRFIDDEQSLWEIAKECGTTMAAIRQANELAESLENVSHTMLLIPVQV